MTKRLIVLGGLALLVACGPKPPTPLTPEQSAALKPADLRLAALYDGSCKRCHTVGDSGAPLTGDRTMWDKRWAKGMPALMQSAVGGLGGMPAGGQCFSCSPADHEALIRFMAAR